MRHGSRLLAAGFCISVAVAVSCGPARSSATPLPAGVLFQDDFANNTTGWDQHTGADVTTNYDSGQYLIAVSQPSVDVWAQPGLDLTDVSVQVDTQYHGGPINNEYGLMCRYQRGGDGKNSFYFFYISTDGYYALGKVSKDVREILSPAQGSPQPTAAIKPADRCDQRAERHLPGRSFGVGGEWHASGRFH